MFCLTTHSVHLVTVIWRQVLMKHITRTDGGIRILSIGFKQPIVYEKTHNIVDI